MQNEMIIILIRVRAAAEVVEIDSLPLSIFDPFHDDDAILHHRIVITVSNFRCEEDGSEVHQYQ